MLIRLWRVGWLLGTSPLRWAVRDAGLLWPSLTRIMTIIPSHWMLCGGAVNAIARIMR